jgi:hypothetical protein
VNPPPLAQPIKQFREAAAAAATAVAAVDKSGGVLALAISQVQEAVSAAANAASSIIDAGEPGSSMLFLVFKKQLMLLQLRWRWYANKEIEGEE